MSKLLLYSKQYQALRTLVMSLDGMDVIFKLTTSPSLMTLLYLNQFQILRTVKNLSHGPGRNRGDLPAGNFRSA